jgi:Cft2 family RNA processing exonuclease
VGPACAPFAAKCAGSPAETSPARFFSDGRIPCCDVFVSEATFGLPVFRFSPARDEVAKLLRSVALFSDRSHLVGAYALGKA